jgi:hypothetical protein
VEHSNLLASNDPDRSRPNYFVELDFHHWTRQEAGDFWLRVQPWCQLPLLQNLQHYVWLVTGTEHAILNALIKIGIYLAMPATCIGLMEEFF